MIGELDDSLFLQHYQGGGQSSYQSNMMTKVALYTYSQKVYSCKVMARMYKVFAN